MGLFYHIHMAPLPLLVEAIINLDSRYLLLPDESITVMPFSKKFDLEISHYIHAAVP